VKESSWFILHRKQWYAILRHLPNSGLIRHA
jgi:hypothetical protein